MLKATEALYFSDGLGDVVPCVSIMGCTPVLTLGSPEARYERRYNVKTATAAANMAEHSAPIRHRGDFDGPTPSVRECLPDSAANAPARQTMITTISMISGFMDSSYGCLVLCVGC